MKMDIQYLKDNLIKLINIKAYLNQEKSLKYFQSFLIKIEKGISLSAREVEIIMKSKEEYIDSGRYENLKEKIEYKKTQLTIKDYIELHGSATIWKKGSVEKSLEIELLNPKNLNNKYTFNNRAFNKILHLKPNWNDVIQFIKNDFNSNREFYLRKRHFKNQQ